MKRECVSSSVRAVALALATSTTILKAESGLDGRRAFQKDVLG